MKVFIYRLKRYKFLYMLTNIIILPIRLPIFIIYKSSELLTNVSDCILGFIDECLYKFNKSIVKIFKFEDIARKQKDSGLYGDKFNFNRKIKKISKNQNLYNLVIDPFLI